MEMLYYQNRNAWLLIYHVPNEGKRTTLQGANLKRLGMVPGQPDYCLPVPRGTYGALYIEMKTTRGSLTESQITRLTRLHEAGNATCVCFGAEEAFNAVQSYLGGTYVQESAIQRFNNQTIPNKIQPVV